MVREVRLELTPELGLSQPPLPFGLLTQSKVVPEARTRTRDLSFTKTLLYHLSYSGISKVVSVGGFEPPAPCFQGTYSSQTELHAVWWTASESNRVGRACRAHLRPGGRPVSVRKNGGGLRSRTPILSDSVSVFGTDCQPPSGALRLAEGAGIEPALRCRRLWLSKPTRYRSVTLPYQERRLDRKARGRAVRNMVTNSGRPMRECQV